jgi:hypothetical protein
MNPVIAESGPENDEGGFVIGGNARISYDHIESVATVTNATCAIIVGTNADDDISIIARDASTHAGADGVRDFTTVVNAGAEILWINVADLHVDALAGDDDIVLRTPAPNLAAWNVNVFIAGGLPSAVTGDQGDVFELETPGTNGVRYTPTGSDTGVIALDTNNNATFDTTITLGAFGPVCAPLNYVSSPGGIEQFIYDGENGNDTFTVLGDQGGAAVADTIVHTLGDAADEGTFRVNNLLGVTYQNVGLAATLIVNGGSANAVDTFRFIGTDRDDTFSAAAFGANNRVTVAGFVPVQTTNVESLAMVGLSGNDSFNVNLNVTYTNISVEGDNPSASDSLTLTGVSGTVENLTLTPASTQGNGSIAEAVSATTVTYSGLEHLFLSGNAGDVDTLVINDDLRDNTWNVSKGTVGDLVQIAGREAIDYNVFNAVTLTNRVGTDEFNIQPTSLVGYTNTFTVNGDAAVAPEPVDDVLHLIGTQGADVVTATATTVTVNGKAITVGNTNFAELRISTLGGNDVIGHDGVGPNPAPLALNLAGVRKVVDAGAGNDIVNMSATMDADIFGGDGDDNIVGTPLADNIYGGRGNDTIFGLAGDDTIYGEDGNDVATGGLGNDRFFGGDGSDLFIWNQGDGSDLIEGDGGGADVVRFNGATAAQVATENFTLSANTSAAPNTAARLLLARTQGGVNLDIAGVEQIDINGDTGVETVTVNDLHQTELKVLNLDLGAAGDTEAVTVNGRSLDDNLLITLAGGIVNVAGLRYDVNIAAAVAAAPDNDRLTVNGNNGNDTIAIGDNVEGTIDMTLNGGAGNDHLTAGSGHTSTDTILNGDAGNDFLQGGSGSDKINGGAGEDTLVGGGGQDTYDGGADFDTILIPGTSGADVIRVEQPSATVLEYIVTDQFGTNVQSATVAGGTQDAIANVEEARVEAGNGADTIRVAISDTLFNQANTSLRMTIEGGDDAASDRLAIVDDTGGAGGALPDASILRQNHDITAGTVEVGPANAEPFLHVFRGIEFVQVVADTLAPLAPVNIESAGIPNRLVVFKDDGYEHNNDRNNATHLGANTTVNLDPTIDPGPGAFALPGDTDWYRVEALVSGTIDFQIVFEQINAVGARPGLPGNGDLNINVVDADGTVIANFKTSDDDDDNERVRIPAVQGEIYYFQVVGDVNANGAAINAYDVTVINLPAAVPFDLELDDDPANGQTNPPGAQVDNSDTGRSLFDNRTYDNTPTIIFRLDDGFFLNDLPGNNATGMPLGDSPIPIPFLPGLAQPNAPGFAIAIFDEGATAPAAGNAGGLNIRQPLGFATQLEPGLYSFTVPNNLALEDGSHFLTARVQILDPASPLRTGWGERSASLEIIVDRVPPQSFFGFIGLADTTQGLAAASDSGVNGYPATNVERVTNDTTPSFFGTAEADAIVRVYVDTNGVAGLQSRESGAANPDLFLGLAVASPLDGEGTNQFPGGQWQLDTSLDLNNPLLGFVQDGLRRIYVTAEDLSGNITPDANADLLNIFLDTRGPQVTRVDVNTRNNAAYNIWDHKGTPDGGNDGLLVPTPLVRTLVVSVQDLPNRSNADVNFLYQALFTPVSIDPGYYQLVGDSNGVIPIRSITFTSDPVANGNPASGFVTISFFTPLPDDRFTLTLRDGITDRVGNQLDGETNTLEPHDTQGTLPSGNGVPGGDFVARFTVDSRPELGVWASGTAWVDTNGNETIDPRNADFVNRDIIYTFGNGNSGTDRAFTSDDFFAGNFRNAGPDRNFATGGDNGPADGFDKLAVYGSVGQGIAGPWRFLIDGDNDGVPEKAIVQTGGLGINLNGLPVAGNFDGNRANGDEVAIFTGTQWVFDLDGNFQLETVLTTPQLVGYPIVGDFDGDGFDDLGAWAADRFTFLLTNGTNNAWLTPGLAKFAQINFGFIGVRERPLAADLDQDGIDDIGLWSPDQSGVTPNEGAEWFFLVSNDFTPGDGINDRAFGQVNTLDHPFKPVPFGNDLYMQLGSSYSIPLIGNFDPPATEGVVDLTEEEVTSVLNRLDVNKDGYVTPIDALIVINKLNTDGAQSVFTGVERLLDVNGDGTVAPSDVLAIINYLSANNLIQAEGEGSSAFSTGLTADSVAANSSNYIEVADGQLLAAADTMRLVFAPIAPVSRGLDELFARLDNADHNPGNADGDQASSIDALLAAFSSDELFDAGNSADRDFGSVMDELLSDDDLLDVNRLAADVLSTYITDK